MHVHVIHQLILLQQTVISLQLQSPATHYGTLSLLKPPHFHFRFRWSEFTNCWCINFQISTAVLLSFQAPSQNCEKRLLASSCLSFCPSARNKSAPTRRIPIKFDVLVFFQKSVEKIKVSLKSCNNNGYFTWRRFNIYGNISLNSS